ncbi:response regulator [Brevundimonas sp. S30B]|uniref:response regulator n=1 Tax=unclassified Brevundimonas TaxID=2622653 RepID=UPI001072B499|nr:MULTISPECIES: response regulator [unclassified Brevundimonas]QBX38182.1 response regulator [Brevundimonas sp. MF30-B]TFW01682.1 response regulator [Brevundimonas sp. S30B]
MSEVGENLRESAVFNLSGAVTMVIDDSSFSMDLTTHALLGFGIKTRYACHSAEEAVAILKDHNVDLIIVDCEMPGMDGYEFVRWLRRSGLEPNAFAPVIMTAGHVRRNRVTEARDCGANFLITKPFSAAALLERVIWVARDTRPFMEVGDYFGPDRRFREGSPPGEERRADKIRLAKMKAEQAAAAATETQEAS